MEERPHSSLLHSVFDSINPSYHLQKTSTLVQEEGDKRVVSVRKIFDSFSSLEEVAW